MHHVGCEGQVKAEGGKVIFSYDLEMDGGRSGKRGSGSGWVLWTGYVLLLETGEMV